MKIFVMALLALVNVQAASVSLNITKLTTLKGDSKLHKFVYLAESLAAATSMGLDGYSTEVAVVQTPNKLRAQGYPCQPCIQEGNALFLSNTPTSAVPQFSQAKFWTYKVSFAAAPFVFTWALHHYRADSKGTDIGAIVGSGAMTALFTTAGIKNFNLAKRTIDENHTAYPKP